MAIVDPVAIKFSNEKVRVAADRLATAFYKAQNLSNRWNALGGGQTAIDLMLTDLRAFADYLLDTYEFIFRTEKIWFVLGGVSLIPNDSSQIWDNGSFTAQDSGRPKITGQSVVALIDRCVQFQNWLLSSTGSFSDSARNSLSWFNTVVNASSWGPTMDVSGAGNLINRANELVTNYSANSNQLLGTVLAVAVNVRN